MQNQNSQLDILKKYLGDMTQKKDNNYAFHCPFCNHHKQKLEVDLDTGLWNCWVCHTKGKGISYLLKKMRAGKDDIHKIKTYENYNNKVFDFSEQVITLPDHFSLLTKEEDSVIAKICYDYLLSRGLTDEDILRYKIGYIYSGKNLGNIVIPSYSSSGYLNYYVFKNPKTGMYLNPKHPKSQVFFDIFINWNDPIVMNKILKSSNSTYYICLDGDAKSSVMAIAQYLISIGKTVFNVELPYNEDPSSLGHKKVWEMIKNSKLITEKDILFSSLLESL
jgi:ribosomal protein L37AE/L43A